MPSTLEFLVGAVALSASFLSVFILYLQTVFPEDDALWNSWIMCDVLLLEGRNWPWEELWYVRSLGRGVGFGILKVAKSIALLYKDLWGQAG